MDHHAAAEKAMQGVCCWTHCSWSQTVCVLTGLMVFLCAYYEYLREPNIIYYGHGIYETSLTSSDSIKNLVIAIKFSAAF